MESIGIESSAGEIPASAKSIERVKRPVSDSASPLRRSVRLKGKSCEDSCKSEGDAKTETCACGDLENSARYEKKGTMASAGGEFNMGEIQIISSSTETIELSKPNSVTACRLKGESCDSECTSPKELSEEIEDRCKSECMETTDDHVSGIADYERLRIARIRENKARMASLGIDRSIKELKDIFSFRKSNAATKRIHYVKPDLSTPCRRSGRLQGGPCEFARLPYPERRRSTQTYYPIFWFCCHVCRQKKLCGEEECRCCGDQDINQPCIGKTQCSSCCSPKGVMCRACLKVRYGEEMEEVRKNKDWMCPHCIEEKGINPYWICNSSLCLEKRKMPLTGIVIDQAREQGYESIAHLIMDKLKRGGDF